MWRHRRSHLDPLSESKVIAGLFITGLVVVLAIAIGGVWFASPSLRAEMLRLSVVFGVMIATFVGLMLLVRKLLD